MHRHGLNFTVAGFSNGSVDDRPVLEPDLSIAKKNRLTGPISGKCCGFCLFVAVLSLNFCV
jgi:hypothetical protein